MSVTRASKAAKLTTLVVNGMLTCRHCESVFFLGILQSDLNAVHDAALVAERAAANGWTAKGHRSASYVCCTQHAKPARTRKVKPSCSNVAKPTVPAESRELAAVGSSG